ncbi:MAG: sensor histidine kinase, partial [Pyrinomonadaceae bacterium]|nr:sensor histidine kinase [Pyrinomonadaceae bacterium]
FYALCAAIALALAFGLYLLRVRRMRQQFALVLAERTRVAREMHDTLIQGVVGASAVLEAVSGMLPQTTSLAYGYLERARDQLRQSLDDARRAVWDLRNPSAQAQDLTTALRRTVERLAADTPAKIEMEQTGRAKRLDGACEESLLRVAQEAVANAVTHAGARRIKVRLHFAARSVRLSVGDDGRGFDASQSLAFNGDNHHFGLAGMHERAAACGGHLTVESVPGSGTTIIATLPV